MKAYLKTVLTLAIFFFFLTNVHAQQDSVTIEIKVVTKNDGVKYTGIILKDDGREVQIRTKELGDLYIPKQEIASIENYDPSQFSKEGKFMGEDLFATRYAFTTNGLPLKKGENYVMLNLFGPEFTFGIAKNFNIGVMTSWIGAPLMFTAKGSIPINENLHLGLGGLLGWGGPWSFGARINNSFGALPFASLTIGNRKNNFSINGGYLLVSYPMLSSGRELFNRPMLGVAGLAKISDNVSLVFDSFVLPANTNLAAVLMPGLRFQSKKRQDDRAFGFNLTIIYADGTFVPLPLPNFQWFIKV